MLELRDATEVDMEWIKLAIEAFRLDGENLEFSQFIVCEDFGTHKGFGRIKPYGDGSGDEAATHELCTVGVMQSFRREGVARLIVTELIKRFPSEKVWVTTDRPQIFERFGFKTVENEALPPILQQKLKTTCLELKRESSVGMVRGK